MAITISKVISNFDRKLDLTFAEAAITGSWSVTAEMVKLKGAGKVEIPSYTLSGLGQYDRTNRNAFPAGNINISWETKSLEYDRGREFQIDYITDEEVDGLLVANVMGEFVRTQVAPEVDKIRFARVYENKGIESTTALTKANFLTEWDKMLAYFRNNSIPVDGLECYITPETYNTLKQVDGIDRNLMVTTAVGLNRNITTLDGVKLVIVPKSYLKTAITVAADGVTVPASAKQVNLMAFHSKYLMAVQKHAAIRHFAPDKNLNANAHLFQYRLHHDLFVAENKKKAIYIHRAA